MLSRRRRRIDEKRDIYYNEVSIRAVAPIVSNLVHLLPPTERQTINSQQETKGDLHTNTHIRIYAFSRQKHLTREVEENLSILPARFTEEAEEEGMMAFLFFSRVSFGSSLSSSLLRRIIDLKSP